MAGVGLTVLRWVLALMLIGGLHEYAPPSWGAGVLLAFLGLSLIVTLVHELGHALAVWMLRGAVIEISVFGLTYAPERRRFAWKPLPSRCDLGGYVSYLPPEEDWTRRQYAVVTAAGPLADALLAALALASFQWMTAPDPASSAPVARAVAYDGTVPAEAPPRPGNLPSSEKHARIVAEVAAQKRWQEFSALAAMLMVVAFLSATGNLLPYRGSDGALLLELWRGRNRFPRPRRR